MKKYFIMAVAVLATLTACQPDEPQTTIVETREISFAPAATQTRATPVKDYTIDNLIANGFAVWGYVSPDKDAQTPTWEPLFTKTLVTQQTIDRVEVWQPAAEGDVKYWSPNSDYIFSAIYPKDAANYTFGSDKTQTITNFAIVNGGLETEDLLVSRVAEATLANAEQRVAVGLTFDHMLARVRFQFTNTFADENVTIKVTNVQLHGVVDEATATLAMGKATLSDQNQVDRLIATWEDADQTSTTTINFQDVEDQNDVDIAIAQNANAATQYRLFIPQTVANEKYTLTFGLEVLADGVTVLRKSYKVDGEDEEAAVALKGFDYVNGNSYLFNANISGDLLKEEIFPIQFEVTVTDWDDDTTVDEDIFNPNN